MPCTNREATSTANADVHKRVGCSVHRERENFNRSHAVTYGAHIHAPFLSPCLVIDLMDAVGRLLPHRQVKVCSVSTSHLLFSWAVLSSILFLFVDTSDLPHGTPWDVA